MDVDALISAIFVRNPLWDQTDSQHHNRFILDKLWDAVAKEMNSTRSIVRTKWKNLRDSFRKELKKMPVKRSGDGASSWKSSWQYFDSLYFLKDQFTARVSTGNLPSAEQDTILDEDTNSQVSESNTQNLDDTTCVDESPLVNVSSQNEGSELNNATPVVKRSKRKHQNDADIGNALVQLEQEKLKILEKQQKKSPDEDSCFFDSLLPHIRTLTPQKKMLLRIKLQELVYNFVYENHQSNQDNGSRSTSQTMHVYDRNSSQMIQSHNDYSNPTSVGSYFTNFSGDSMHDL